MSYFPETIGKIINIMKKIQGIGRKSAERIVFSLMKMSDEDVEELGESIKKLKSELKFCSICGNITDKDVCDICLSDKRDNSKICVVEQVQNLMTIERTGVYKGKYFVLHGVLSPIRGIGPDELSIEKLKKIVKERGVKEIIVATNPTVEGEATAMFIKNEFKDMNTKITRLAVGLPAGGDIDFSDSFTISLAFEKRDEI